MKDELRLRFRAVRDAVGLRKREEASKRIAEHLLGMEEFERAKTILFYASFGSEVSTVLPIQEARRLGKDVALPRMEGRDLRVHAWTGERPLVVNRHGIPEPEGTLPDLDASQIDLAVVPGLAFDTRGMRLGYGGGYYDRFLRTASHSFKVGLGFASQVVPRLPSTARDVALDAVITETGVNRANPRGR